MIAAELIAEFSGDQIEVFRRQGILKAIAGAGGIKNREAIAGLVPLQPAGVAIGGDSGNEQIAAAEGDRHPLAAEAAGRAEAVAEAVLGKRDHPLAADLLHAGVAIKAAPWCGAVERRERLQVGLAEDVLIQQLQNGTAETQLGQGDVGGVVELSGGECGRALVAFLGQIGFIEATAVARLHPVGGEQPLLLGALQQGAEGHAGGGSGGHRHQIARHLGFQRTADRLIVGGGDHLDRTQSGPGIAGATRSGEVFPGVGDVAAVGRAEFVGAACEGGLGFPIALQDGDVARGGAEELELLGAGRIAEQPQAPRAAAAAVGLHAEVVEAADRLTGAGLQRVGGIDLVDLHPQG